MDVNELAHILEEQGEPSQSYVQANAHPDENYKDIDKDNKNELEVVFEGKNDEE